MAILSNLLSSNAIQLAFTLTAGIIVYLALFFVPRHKNFSNSGDQALIVTKNFFLVKLEILGIVFFILLVFLNQTQQCIQSTSILLFLSGFCMAHIWQVELLRRIKKND